MKKILLFATILCSCVLAKAQVQLPEYQPMLDEGKVWVNSLFYTHGGWHKYFLFRYELRGDSVVGNFKYKKCYAIPEKEKIASEVASYNGFTWSKTTPVALLREENMKVYCILNPKMEFHANTNASLYDDDGQLGQECLLYDFASLRSDPNMKYEIVQIDGKQCVLYDNEDSYLESIGGIYGTLFAPFWVYPPAMGGSYTVCRLSHVLDSNGEIIYKGPYYWELNPPSGVNDVKVTETADDSYYNLMGQPVEHPEDAPGIYIHEGKKVKF